MLDFIIIGGGIAGVSAAARLSSIGKVTLLEAEDGLGYHASGRSAALFEASYGVPTTIALNKASRDFHMTANGGVLSPRGLMLIAAPSEEAAFEADLAAMAMPEITADEAVTRFPILRRDRIARAAAHDDAWDIDTDRLIQDFARQARANDGKVLTSHGVTCVARRRDGWDIQVGDRGFSTRHLVNAAGAWADRIASMAGVSPIGLVPHRRSMARLPAPGGRDVSRWPMVVGAGEAWYAKPDAGSLLVSPGDADPMEPHDAWADDMVIAEGLARYEAMVTEPVSRVTVTWAGLRTFSPDRSLVIGPDPEVPSFLWFAGQGGYGFQTAPAASACLAAHLTGSGFPVDAATVAALDPARFRQGQAKSGR